MFFVFLFSCNQNKTKERNDDDHCEQDDDTNVPVIDPEEREETVSINKYYCFISSQLTAPSLPVPND